MSEEERQAAEQGLVDARSDEAITGIAGAVNDACDTCEVSHWRSVTMLEVTIDGVALVVSIREA